jgi:RNA polymerase sigma-70 factor (ECF subfamily)
MQAGLEVMTTDAGADPVALVAQVRAGDDEAASALVRHLSPLVLKIVRSHLPRRTSEEDLTQAVFMKIFAKLDQFSGRVPLEHWVARVAVNTCLNQLDRERARPELRLADLSEEEEQVVQTLAATEAEIEPGHHLAARELVEKLLGRLGPDDRLVLTLLHLEGRSVAETRELTGWSETGIKVRAFRARRKLRKHWDKLVARNET